MLKLLNSDKRIINIDETWLPHFDFRRMKWQVRGKNNSIPNRELSQKVNMIASVDTQGEIYVALTTVNTDANVMLMFLSRLAIRLT